MAQNDKFMKSDIAGFAFHMKKLLNNKEMSDIKFLIGPSRKTVYAHKCILAARCEVFRAMFVDQAKSPLTDSQEVPFVLSDVTPEIFLTVLEFIYTNCATISGKIVVDILGSAIEYGLDDLRKLCVTYMLENMSASNACEAMQAAVTYGQDDLRERTLSYIEQNTANVLRSKTFHEMSDDAVCIVLKSDRLLIDELDVLSAVREWATVNSVVAGKSVRETSRKVIPHVRLPLLSAEELTMVEKDNEKDNLIPMDMMAFAWRFHALKKGDRNNPLTRRRKGTVLRECHRALEGNHSIDDIGDNVMPSKSGRKQHGGK
ncbi:BTB/POZ domain-containing protein 19-like [Lineus longissimus]|uniref:BTB/POZ domain-containing protein 19-like n=1 Tax=Lineus longissimus TaxID=88925 RepID=UPI002B4D9AEC